MNLTERWLPVNLLLSWLSVRPSLRSFRRPYSRFFALSKIIRIWSLATISSRSLAAGARRAHIHGVFIL